MSSDEKKCLLSDLPTAVWHFSIIPFLSIAEICHLACVTKYAKCLCYAEELWSSIELTKYWSVELLSFVLPEEHSSRDANCDKSSTIWLSARSKFIYLFRTLIGLKHCCFCDTQLLSCQEYACCACQKVCCHRCLSLFRCGSFELTCAECCKIS